MLLMMFASWFSATSLFAQPASGPAPSAPTESVNEAAERVEKKLRMLESRVPLAIQNGMLELGMATEKGPFLGVTASRVPAVLRDQLKLRPGIGLVVDFVMPDSPAAAAGLKKSDVIEKLGDQLLVNPQQLAVLVRTHKVGDEVQLSILRETRPMTITAKLAEGDLPPIEELGAGTPARIQDVLTKVRKATGGAPFITADGITVGGGGGGGWRLIGDGAFGLVWSDKEHTFNITQSQGGERTLNAKDKANRTIYDGPINTDEDVEKLPKEIREKVMKLKKSRLDAPTTVPSIRMRVAPPQTAPLPPGAGGA
jgi:hypothetical protein